MVKDKSQAAMEYIIIFGVVVLGVLLVSMFIPKLDRSIERDDIESFGNMLSSEINQIRISGPNNVKRVDTIIPDRIEDFYYIDNSLVMTIAGKTIDKRHYSVDTPIVGEISYGAVYMEYFSNDTSEYVCIYSDNNRKECCLDFMCNMDSLN